MPFYYLLPTYCTYGTENVHQVAVTQDNYRSLTNPVVKEKGEAKATRGSVDFSFSLTLFHWIYQRTITIMMPQELTYL